MKALSGSRERSTLLLALATALVAILVYANSLASGFAYDDE